jgi:hypothetical protein
MPKSSVTLRDRGTKRAAGLKIGAFVMKTLLPLILRFRLPGARRWLSCIVGGVILSIPSPSQATAVSLTTANNPYSQNFNTLISSGTSSTLPAGWAISESGTSASVDGKYTAGTGSSATADTYSFGAVGSTERALGMLQSGTLIAMMGVQLQNDMNSPLHTLLIEYAGEQWRLGALGRLDRLDFQYSLNANSLTTGTWTDINALDFTAPITSGTVGGLNGNLAANRTLISASLTGLNLLNGQSIWFRWNDFNAAGFDDALAIDDFTVKATKVPESLPPWSSLFLLLPLLGLPFMRRESGAESVPPRSL